MKRTDIRHENFLFNGISVLGSANANMLRVMGLDSFSISRTSPLWQAPNLLSQFLCVFLGISLVS